MLDVKIESKTNRICRNQRIDLTRLEQSDLCIRDCGDIDPITMATPPLWPDAFAQPIRRCG